MTSPTPLLPVSTEANTEVITSTTEPTLADTALLAGTLTTPSVTLANTKLERNVSRQFSHRSTLRLFKRTSAAGQFDRDTQQH
mgnify:CR=1 FL=1